MRRTSNQPGHRVGESALTTTYDLRRLSLDRLHVSFSKKMFLASGFMQEQSCRFVDEEMLVHQESHGCRVERSNVRESLLIYDVLSSVGAPRIARAPYNTSQRYEPLESVPHVLK